MTIKIKVYTIVTFLISIISLFSFYIFSILFKEQFILYLSIPFTLGTFLFLLFFFDPKKGEKKLSIMPPFDERVIFIIIIFSILTVLLIPDFSGSMLEWMKIPPQNWLRYLCSILLTSFIPGFLLLKLIDRKREINGFIIIILSYIFSVFISFLMGYIILLSNNSIILLGLPTMIAINLLLIIPYIFTSQKITQKSLLTINYFELGFLFSIFTIILVESLVIMSNNMPLTLGDMRGNYGVALQYLHGFPIYGGNLITYEGGYLFYIYLDILFSISGIPAALSEQCLYILSFIPILAFYTTVKVWFSENEEKFPVIATFLSILLGFGGLYALYIRFVEPSFNINQLLSVATSKTYDIYMRILYLPDIVSPTWNIGLPAFFTLLFFIKKDVYNLTKFICISIIVAFGWLGHIAEIIIFVAIFVVYTLFIKQNKENNIGPYIMIGLLLVAVIDLIAPARIYISSNTEIYSTPFFVTLFLVIFASVIETLKDKPIINLPVNIIQFLLNKLKITWQYSRWILLYIYIFFFIVWLTIQNDYNLWIWGEGYLNTPFFVLPLRLGAIGLLAIISLMLFFSDIISNENLFIFFSMIIIGFILEQISNYIKLGSTAVSIGYPTYRFATFTFIGAIIIATYGIIKLSKIISLKYKTIVAPFIAIIMIISMLSTSLYYVNASYYSINNIPSQDELDTYDYLRQNNMMNCSVLTFTSTSVYNLITFSGLNDVQDSQRWSNLLISTSNPYIITYILSLSNIRYIYLTKSDVKLINSNNILKSIIYSFPKVIENNYATIYKVPQLNPPSINASLGIFHLPPSEQKLEPSPWIEESFDKGWSLYRKNGNIKNSFSEAKNGTMEISVTSNQVGNVWASYALPNLSLNTTIYPKLSFRYRVENNFTWFTFQLRNSSNSVIFYQGNLSAKDFKTMEFVLPQNQIITKIEILVETIKDAPTNTTALASIDYIIFSSIVSSWSDDTLLSNWEFNEKYGNIISWSALSNGDILKLNVTSNQKGNVWVSYSHPLFLKTKDSIINFRYKVDNDYTWFTVILQTASNKYFFYKGHLIDKEFTIKSFSLPDDQTLTKVQILVETTDKAPAGSSAIVYLDNIAISQRPFSVEDIIPALFTASLQVQYSFTYIDNTLIKNFDAYTQSYKNILLTSDPVIPFDSLIKWVSNGNTLTVLNTYGYGIFANLLEINESSPRLSQRNMGLGKILYINSYSLSKVGRSTEVIQPEILDKMRNTLKLEKYVYKVNILPVYNSTFGGIEVKGDLNIHTDILKLQGFVDIIDSPIQFNEGEEISIFGEVSLTITKASLFIIPSESYLIIKPEKYPIEGEIQISGSNSLIVSNGKVIYTSEVPMSMKFKSNGLSLLAKLPSLNASGEIIFDQMDVHSALYIPLAGIVQEKAKVQGSVIFKTMYIDYPIILYSNFQAEGNIFNLAPKELRSVIPWSEVLTSPYNIAFNTIFLIGVIIYISRKKMKNKHDEVPF